MATRHIDDKLRCPHCLEELDYLEEPKQLPCSHIYCLPCLITLTVINLTGVQVTCSICSNIHQMIDLSGLPSPRQYLHDDQPKESESGESEPQVQVQESAEKCDRCKDSKKAAVCFCQACQKRLCPLHEQLHQEYFVDEEQEHKLVSIQNYERAPGIYTKPMCAKHGEVLAMWCQNCFRFQCHKCQTDDTCTSKRHSFISLEDASLQVKQEFELLLKKCSVKMTELCKQEKQAWQKVDDVEQTCKTLKRDIETKTDQLVTFVREESRLAISRVENFENTESKRIEAHATDLRLKRESLDTYTRHCIEFLGNNNIVDICQMKVEKQNRLEKDGSDTTPGCEWNIEHAQDMIVSYQALNPKVIPKKIHFLSTHSNDGGCYCTHFRSDGCLLVGVSSGIKLYEDNYCQPKTEIKSHLCREVTSIDDHNNDGNKGYIFIVHKRDTRKVCLTTDFINSKQHFELEYPGGTGAFLATSAEAIAVGAHESIIIYNKEGIKQFTKQLTHQPCQLRFDRSGNLLETDHNCLRKYHLKDDDMYIIWTCEPLIRPYGLCTMKNGLIIVISSGDNGCLSLVSEEGDVLVKLEHDELIPYADGAISISDQGVLAVPYWGKQMFKRFQII